jgi:fibrillarin-like pre-rRNA processing protein
MEIERLFNGVFRIDNKLATINLAPGIKVYDEELLRDGKIEYRTWNPYRSKLAAAMQKGLKHMEIKDGDSVLYLGAATGTTCSHISDIIGDKGSLFCIEISERSMRDLLKLCEHRSNVLPMLQDARNVSTYGKDVGTVDAIYEDVAAPDQAEMLLYNSELLKSGGFAYVAIKSQSIDVSKKPTEVYDAFIKKVSTKFALIEAINIEPFDRMHLFVVFKKR